MRRPPQNFKLLKVTVNDIEFNTKLILRAIKDFEQNNKKGSII